MTDHPHTPDDQPDVEPDVELDFSDDTPSSEPTLAGFDPADAASTDDDVELNFSDDEADAAVAEAEDELNLDFDADGAGAEATDTDTDIQLDFAGSEPDEPEEDTGLNFGDDEPETPEADAPDADLLAEAMEDLRSELRAKPGDWYVVHTYSGMEKRVKQNLEQRAQSLDMEHLLFDVRVPTEEVAEIRSGNKKMVTRTVLPGYVLVCMEFTDESWGLVRHTPSVTGFVGNATAPIPLTLDEVERMLAPSVVAQVNKAAKSKSRPVAKPKVEVADLAVGDSVMVTDGPFAGVHASITEINANSQRLKALVEILGRDTPIDLTFSQVEKV